MQQVWVDVQKKNVYTAWQVFYSLFKRVKNKMQSSCIEVNIIIQVSFQVLDS